MSTETDPIPSPLRGLTTVVFPVTDFDAAKSWYTKVFGIAPYMDTPAYAEFRVGDYQHEFGLLNVPMSGGFAQAPAAAGGAIVYWHVDDIEAELARLVSLGATLHQPARDFGRGFIGASVIDPFGHILALMYNPHYLAVAAARAV
ncbi:VOC family protein [Devosia sediminis]|uniref:VOC family protein n=1 Tax=Devosia sediminis TaxID=2798801 RepID=A0A934IWY2_9HYPH|nr:VOC family protein [Devosia sediminis]MBJ3784288.1 VOC family protein [Devosia sediminis]